MTNRPNSKTKVDRKQHRQSKLDQTEASKRYKKTKLKLVLKCEKTASKLSQRLVQHNFLTYERPTKSMTEKAKKKITLKY